VRKHLRYFLPMYPALSGHHLILWQLPPSLKQNLTRLSAFLDLLPSSFKHAFEFRHQSWVNQETWCLLKKYNAAVVFQDWKEWPQTNVATADFIYIRFHGNKILYTSEYTYQELQEWSRVIKKYLGQGKDIYAYFNNDSAGFAVSNALGLKKLVGWRPLFKQTPILFGHNFSSCKSMPLLLKFTIWQTNLYLIKLILM